MTPEDVQTLKTGDPVYLAYFSANSGSSGIPHWAVEREIVCGRMFGRHGNPPDKVILGPPGADSRAIGVKPAKDVFLRRLDALQWVNDRLTEYRAMMDEETMKMAAAIRREMDFEVSGKSIESS
jgi:hypothetical protein